MNKKAIQSLVETVANLSIQITMATGEEGESYQLAQQLLASLQKDLAEAGSEGYAKLTREQKFLLNLPHYDWDTILVDLSKSEDANGYFNRDSLVFQAQTLWTREELDRIPYYGEHE